MFASEEGLCSVEVLSTLVTYLILIYFMVQKDKKTMAVYPIFLRPTDDSYATGLKSLNSEL
jgi:hypothetical protein